MAQSSLTLHPRLHLNGEVPPEALSHRKGSLLLGGCTLVYSPIYLKVRLPGSWSHRVCHNRECSPSQVPVTLHFGIEV